MTDVSHQPALATPDRAGVAQKPWPLAPYILVAAAGAGGLMAGRALGGDADAFEANLLLLLRFMAAMKFLAVLGGAAATHWRLTHPIEQRMALAYEAALIPMAAGAGLIWSLGGIALGAVLFHIGLLAFLCLASTDGGVRIAGRR